MKLSKINEVSTPRRKMIGKIVMSYTIKIGVISLMLHVNYSSSLLTTAASFGMFSLPTAGVLI